MQDCSEQRKMTVNLDFGFLGYALPFANSENCEANNRFEDKQ